MLGIHPAAQSHLGGDSNTAPIIFGTYSYILSLDAYKQEKEKQQATSNQYDGDYDNYDDETNDNKQQQAATKQYDDKYVCIKKR